MPATHSAFPSLVLARMPSSAMQHRIDIVICLTNLMECDRDGGEALALEKRPSLCYRGSLNSILRLGPKVGWVAWQVSRSFMDLGGCCTESLIRCDTRVSTCTFSMTLSCASSSKSASTVDEDSRYLWRA